MGTAIERIRQARQLNLESLDLSRCGLFELPSELFQLTSLRYLNLSNNHLSCLPTEFSSLINLCSVELTSNQFFEFPEVLATLPNLRSLEFGINHLTALPACLGKMSGLVHAYFYRNLISELAPEIGSLKKLRTLSLNINLLRQFPEALTALESLEILGLNRNQIRRIPKSILNLNQLRELSLSSNLLKIVPECLWGLPQLERLDIGYNQIEALAPANRVAGSLKFLSVVQNPIKNWSRHLLSLNSLRDFVADPVTLQRCPADVRLFISEKNRSGFEQSLLPLESLRQYVHFRDPAALMAATSIRIENQVLSEIPRAIFFLKNLRSLKIINCQISEIPDEIRSLKHLECLHLHSNSIERVPVVLAALPQLVELDLSNNCITECDPNIARLSHLKILKLHNNLLSHIPESVILMPSLKVLDIRNTPYALQHFAHPEDLDSIRGVILKSSESQIRCVCHLCRLDETRFATFDGTLLQRYLAAERFTIVCPESLADVSVYCLLNIAAPNKNYQTKQFDLFTPQERKVAALLCEGRSNMEIGAELFISLSTVKNHVHRLYRKLAVNDRAGFLLKVLG